MKKLLSSILGLAVVLGGASSAQAQRSRHADVWVFGTRCQLSWDAAGTTVTPGTFPLIATAEGSASLADPATGELLVASDGVTVWDGAGTMVATGLAGHTSSMHSAVIIPRPLTPNRLFVISHGEGSTSSVAYREIDTTGPVTAIGTNTMVSLDGGAATGREGMVLIQHANGVDYWLLVSGNNAVFILPVTVAGIGTPVRVATSVPLAPTPGWNLFAANNAGTRLVISEWSSVNGDPRPIVLYDFDRATGALSGRRQITVGIDREYYGGAFSPDDTKLYFSTLTSRAGSAVTPQVSRVYQYDLTADRFTMLHEDERVYSNGQTRLGPDGRVYVATGSVPDRTVSVIENPNSAGVAAGFRYGAITMPSACSPALGLPQTVSPTARLRFGVDITSPRGTVGGTSTTPEGTANVADGATVTVRVTGPGGFSRTCTATVRSQMWSCPAGAIMGLVPGNAYQIEASLSPTVTDDDTFLVGGCIRDTQCDTATQFCDTARNVCVPRIPNGNAVPTITGHEPVLDGMCTEPAGASVCVSRVCEASDDLCGYRNGPMGGPCTAANGTIVCRSGVCSPGDMMCGYRDGEGPCTAANGAIVCRSGLCGTDGRCRPSTGCNVDADCDTAVQYCDTPSRTCVPRVPNSMAVPTVPGHVPTLAGECTIEGAQSACLSRVCEDDDLCGLRNGSPCVMPSVCRSAICAPNSRCGACDRETPCPTGEICDVPTGTCLPTGDAGPRADAGPHDTGASDAGNAQNPDAGRGGLAGGACGCTVTSQPGSSGFGVLFGVLGLVVAGRRRRAA